MRPANAAIRGSWPNRSLLMVWGALLAGGASLLGGILQNKAAKKAADTQMAFQRESAQNRYQWTMADMRKAGLNPLLAYQQGGGGTLGGSSYTPANIGAAAVQGAVGGASSALSTKRGKSEDALRDATVRNMFEMAKSNHWNAEKSYEETENMRVLREILKNDLVIRRAEASSAKHNEAFYNSKAGAIAKKIDLWGRSINPLSSPTRAIRGR